MTFNDRLEICPFPKHEGIPWGTVVEGDYQYVVWLISGEGPDLDPDMEERLTDLAEGWRGE